MLAGFALEEYPDNRYRIRNAHQPTTVAVQSGLKLFLIKYTKIKLGKQLNIVFCRILLRLYLQLSTFSFLERHFVCQAK
jgi:hypothetical protein